MVKEPENIPEIVWIEKLAVLLDSKFSIPGTKVRFGLDPLIGLIPIAGNISTMIISMLLVMSMAHRGASRKVMILMGINIFVDTVIGSIPVLGNIFDFSFKSNIKNVRLLKAHYYEGRHQGSGTWILVIIFTAVLATMAFFIWGIYKLISFLAGQWDHHSF